MLAQNVQQILSDFWRQFGDIVWYYRLCVRFVAFLLSNIESMLCSKSVSAGLAIWDYQGILYYMEVIQSDLHFLCVWSSQLRQDRSWIRLRQDWSWIQPANATKSRSDIWKVIDIVNTFCGCSFFIVIVQNTHHSRFDIVLFDQKLVTAFLLKSGSN